MRWLGIVAWKMEAVSKKPKRVSFHKEVEVQVAAAADEEQQGNVDVEEDVEEDEEEELDPYVCWADKSIHIGLLQTSTDVPSLTTFTPEFTHQVVGESEKVVGYEGLDIQLLYSAGALTPFLSMNYEECITDEDPYAQPEDPLPMIREWLPADGIMTSRDAFLAKVDADATEFRPLPSLVPLSVESASMAGSAPSVESSGSASSSAALVEARNDNDTYELTVVGSEVEGFKEYHARAQTFCIWYIESASFLDLEDDKWRVIYLYKKQTSPDGKGSTYSLLGFVSIYLYYAYPENVRPRISQVIVLPPYQRQGHGKRLLRAAYQYGMTLDNLVDITVEDPAPSFTKLRDVVDLENCMQHKDLVHFKFVSTFPTAFLELAQSKLKLSRLQTRRMYEILALFAVQRGELMPEQFETIVQTRLQQALKKEQLGRERMRHVLDADMLAQAQARDEAMVKQCDAQAQALVLEYAQVLRSVLS
eukprot:m.226201 g.226201  ORF g.226201 m.226201 type:complete len:476 (-) comp15165_c0_seq2:497-1924(-)